MNEAVVTPTTPEEEPRFDSAFLRMTETRLDHLDDLASALWLAVGAAADALEEEDCEKAGALRAVARGVTGWLVEMQRQCRDVRRCPEMLAPVPVKIG